MYNDGRNLGISSPVLTNVSFSSNFATSGVAMYNTSDYGKGQSNPVLTNVSFSNNSATSGGAMFSINNYGSQGINRPTLTNGVVFGNGGANSFYNFNGTLSIRYSLLEAGATNYTSGPGNLTTTASPFSSTTSTQLAAGCLAIDAGDPTTTTATVGTTDLAGNPRFVNGRVDMGVYFGDIDQVIPWQIDHPFDSQTTCEKRLLKQW